MRIYKLVTNTRHCKYEKYIFYCEDALDVYKVVIQGVIINHVEKRNVA